MTPEETFAARLLHAREDERRRIARVLHDDISQRIALLAIDVDRLRQELAEAQPETSSRLGRVLEQAQALSLRVGELSRELERGDAIVPLSAAPLSSGPRSPV